MRAMPENKSAGFMTSRRAFPSGKGVSRGLALEPYSVELKAYQKPREKRTISAQVARPGMPQSMSLYWQALAPRSTYVQFVDVVALTENVGLVLMTLYCSSKLKTQA